MATAKTDLRSIPFELTEKDRENLLAGDEHFKAHSWNELKQIIAENNLSILTRKPSDLKRYIVWTKQTKAEYGTMANFVCKERLHWEPLASSTPKTGPLFQFEDARPFAAREDYKILRNDWPYGFDEGIVHLVVWLKTPIPVQQPDGYLLPESKALVDGFVQKTFVQRLKKAGLEGDNQLQWFKNWVSLQSVRGLDHIHVLVRDVPPAIIEEWTASLGT